MEYADLEEVNARINALPYVDDGIDDWVPINYLGEGVCANYATAKFDILVREYGWPHEALRLAYLKAETGRAHLVLLADLAGLSWVLDNRFWYPMRHDDLTAKGYQWVAFQIAGTRNWEAA